MCIPASKSTTASYYIRSIDRQAYIASIQVRSFGTRGLCHPLYNFPLHLTYHFTLSVDRRRRHRLS